ncbi:Rqc2 family fibronectin-binding protein [Clostridium manihotivorum]|uniref:Rqc2 homolog RqcH n=1 Tax=Clostridium manihotivorum TaxID=2320868 RepID=A0A3R5TFE8_9CLOT|nr:NFACT RNA binding domain-containing protein [Clostridium manihotivorum]QAA32046.1 fibronectin/fibrinogen-binding protein [Clostridium manihotivorum]
MALDGVFLSTLIKSLKENLLNCKIDKVNQPEKDEVILTIRGSSRQKLLISASANNPRIHFTKISKENPNQPPMFCMVLRKYLIGSRILDISQYKGDRIVLIDFESTDELGFDSIYTLVVEIMGRHSNITLIRKRDNKVMESIKHITPDINSYRVLYPGVQYVLPPDSNKIDPFSFDKNVLENFLSDNKIEFNENFFSKLLTGVSKILSKELYNMFTKKYIFDINNLYQFTKDFFDSLDNKKTFISYMDKETKVLKDFYCLRLDIYDGYEEAEYEDASSLLEGFYSTKDKQDRLHSKSQDLQKLITTNMDRCSKKRRILESTLEECSEKNDFKVKGDILSAFIYNIKKGQKEVTLSNFYSEDGEDILITLDENKTPSENIQYYYKRYNKLKKSEESAILQLEKNEEEYSYLNSVLTNLLNAENYTEIQDIKSELIDEGYIKFKKAKGKAQNPSKPIHFISSEGVDIYVGKNNIQNDYLTLKFADKNDTWLHTKVIPGSHVIIKGKDFSDVTLNEAANLAAYYSKGKDSTKVPIDYTIVKNVKKPSGAKPGMVIYYTNKTLYVTPEEPKIKRV